MNDEIKIGGVFTAINRRTEYEVMCVDSALDRIGLRDKSSAYVWIGTLTQVREDLSRGHLMRILPATSHALGRVTLACGRCKEPNDYAEPNQPDGGYVCYSCRRGR